MLYKDNEENEDDDDNDDNDDIGDNGDNDDILPKRVSFVYCASMLKNIRDTFIFPRGRCRCTSRTSEFQLR